MQVYDENSCLNAIFRDQLSLHRAVFKRDISGPTIPSSGTRMNMYIMQFYEYNRGFASAAWSYEIMEIMIIDRLKPDAAIYSLYE